jgi:ATP-dependent Clp protease ATP-binding subunit ClpA
VFERTTQAARVAIVQAQEEARSTGQDQIGGGHLLIALAGGTDSLAARALAALGVSQDALRQQVLARTGVHPPDPQGHIPFSEDGRAAIRRSLQVAIGRHQEHVSTGHLLLALTEVSGGDAQPVLTGLGILDQVRQETGALLDAEPDSEGAPPSAPWMGQSRDGRQVGAGRSKGGGLFRRRRG